MARQADEETNEPLIAGCDLIPDLQIERPALTLPWRWTRFSSAGYRPPSGTARRAPSLSLSRSSYDVVWSDLRRYRRTSQ